MAAESASASAPPEPPVGGEPSSSTNKKPTINGRSSIHTLGRGNLGKINSKYPMKSFKKPSPRNNSNADNNIGNEVVSGGSQSTSENNASSSQQENKTNIDGKSNSFTALLSQFGGGDNGNKAQTTTSQSQQKRKDESKNYGSGDYNSNPSSDDNDVTPTAAVAAAPQSSFADKSLSRPTSNNGDNEKVVPTNNNPIRENKDTAQETPAPKKSSSPGKSKMISSFLVQASLRHSKSTKQQSEVASSQSIKPNTTASENNATRQPPTPSENTTTKTTNNLSLKKNPFVKQQSSKHQQQAQLNNKPPSQQPQSRPPNQQSKPSQPRPRPPPQSSRQRSLSKSANNPNNTYSNTTTKSTLNASATSSSTTQKHHNMVQPKTHQRLVLEQVAAQYFLSDNKPTTNNNASRYVGVTDYGDGVDDIQMNGIHNNGSLGNIEEDYAAVTLGTAESGGGGADSSALSRGSSSINTPLGLGDKCINKGREAVVLFLEGITRNNDSDEPYSSIDAKNLSIITEASNSSAASSRKSAEEQSQDIQREANIDRILEMASDHLSLGKNDLALQAYRRAMKVAFADVLSVKQKLVEVKKRQMRGNGNLDSSTMEDLTKQQEQQFELSLLQVASRVADVHNNMGVVHEMNRHYEKARASYVDALEVYHNTCKRFEEKGDPDVDRTKKNVERMALACHSEKERRGLHEKASRIARRVGQEKHFAKRKSLLNEAIATLRNALNLEGETIGSTHPVAASTLVQIGKYHYEIREYDSAVMEIRQAITVLRNALGGNHPQCGKTLLLLASIYERHGMQISPEGTNKDDSELELYVDALEPLKATLGEHHSEVGFLYAKIGYLYGKKDLNLSLLAYKASLKAYGEPSSIAMTGGVHPEVVSIWVRVTEYLTSLKLWDEVVVAGHRALYLLRRSKNILFRDAQLSCNFKTSSSAHIVSSGASVTSQLPMPTAKSSKKSHIQITSDTYYDALFSTLQSLGQAHTSLSNYPLARNACSESLQLAWEMALSYSKAKSKEALTESILLVIRALKRLGKAYLLEKHYTPALECFLPSLELLRSSKEMESTLDCASVLGSLGFLYLKLKKFTESSNFLRACLLLYQKNGVSSNDRETRKIQAWLQMAESREEEISVAPPSFLEIPTIVFNDDSL